MIWRVIGKLLAALLAFVGLLYATLELLIFCLLHWWGYAFAFACLLLVCIAIITWVFVSE